MNQFSFKNSNPQFSDLQSDEGSRKIQDIEKAITGYSFERSSARKGNRMAEMMIQLLQMIAKNDCMIKQLSEIVDQNFQNLEKSSTSSTHPHLQSQHLNYQPQHPLSPPNFLLTQLFGSNNYKYSLQLQGDIPSILYKQRNFQISLKLTDLKQDPVQNNNILNLCLGLCTSEGNWVSANKVGESMLKGKTEVEMYKGEANFNKIYIRDISRHYSGRRLNLVVYCKQSTLIYRENNSYEGYVDWQLVRPLVIEDIHVKAKKKQ